MKKELIIHIGMGKTGTTALQEFFGENRTQLGKKGISYPTYGSVANAHHLLSPFLPNNLKNCWEFKTVADWAPKLLETKHQKILLSSELIAWAASGEVDEFCKCVQESFTLTVVVYVRRQDNIIMANYNQLVKAGSQRRELDEIWEDDCARFNYWRIVEPWARCLGKSNIIVRPYEKEQFYRQDIRHDFMHHVFDIAISSDFILRTGNANPRLHPRAIAYKLCLFKIFTDSVSVGEFNEALLSYSRESDAPDSSTSSNQAILSPKVRNLIIRRQASTNALVAREFLNREDGVLFRESLPDKKGAFTRQKLTRVEAREITRSCGVFSPSLLQLLFKAVSESLDSIDLSRRTAAHFIKSTLPKTMIERLEKRNSSAIFKWRYRSENSKRDDVPFMLISVHFPAVTADGYMGELARVFGEGCLYDYRDRPIGTHGTARNMRSIFSSIRYAALIHESDEALCVHGHFMPLKYRFLQSTLRKRYVTWVRDPVERLAAHYSFWKSSADRGYSGKLRRRMLDEDWTLETFAFCPELRNIYSKYLWGFPLRLFDFVGIVEFSEMESRRFSRDILGSDSSQVVMDDVRCSDEANSNIDSGFRKRVELFHSADVALYQQALQMRREKMGEIVNV